jgi:hypothetical protein
MKRAQVTVPLDIPDVRVLSTEINKVGELIITIESTKEGTTCHQCGREIRKRHGYDEWTIIRHLPVFGRFIALSPAPTNAWNVTVTQRPHASGLAR